MDLSLGPWKGEMSVEETLRQPLADAMGAEAWKIVEKTPGFTPKKSPKGKAASAGYAISGKVTNAIKDGRKVTVMATFQVWVDGTFPNVTPITGQATAEGSMTAVDAIRDITEERITKILGLIKAGSIIKAK